MKLIHPRPSSIIGTQVSARHFTYSKRVFITEASTVGHLGINLESQLYQDACDVGFVLVNPKTGVGVPFFRSGTERDPSGCDIAGIRYRVCEESARMDPRVANMEVLVINT